ncbi:MAG TPA: ABC transporter substrate-binding protein [Acidimicrobiales bacterium]|nr:ABC transporter substrate-binding protein [Acidimicrobiales bacterium]
MQHHSRTGRLLVATALGLALLAAACGSSSKDNEATGSSTTAGPSKELRVGFTEDQYVLEGPDSNLGAYPLNTNVVETLTFLTENYEVKPRLATSWELIPPNTWRFHLRQGVTFHDGQPFNAQAVKTGLFDRVAKRTGGSTIKAGPDSAKVVDDYTIDFTPTVPNLRVPQQLVHPQMAVIAPGSDFGKKPVGTGPFRFVEYAPKERIVVERNPDYWGEKAKLPRITFRFFPDGNVRKLALESGEIDLAYQVPPPDVAALESRFTIKRSTVGAYEAMYENAHGKAPHDILSDVKVRQALAYAVDRKKLIQGTLFGEATDAQTWVPPDTLGKYASAVKGYTYDPAKAAALLDEAGWKAGADGMRSKDGRPLKLQLVSGFPSAEIHRPIPTFLQSELKKIGVDLEIVERPDSASFQALITSGDGDLFLEQGNQNDGNPAFLPVLLLYTGGSGASAPYQTLFAPGPKFDELIAPALTEPDLEKVRQITADAMHEAIDGQATVVPLAGIYRVYGMKKSITGFIPHPSFLNVQWAGVQNP